MNASTIEYPPAPPVRSGNKHWQMICPVISNSHLTREAFISAVQMDVCCGGGEVDENTMHGCTIVIEEPEANGEGFPEFINVMQQFRHLGYDYLRFDPDGDVVPGLQTFDW